MTIKISNTAMTHGGKFHADDVFSTAFLKIMNPNLQITRGFEVPENYTGLVFDIGGGRFDHHQEKAEVRENGIPYAAFGLLWREYGTVFLQSLDCPEEKAEYEALRFDKSFIQPLDEDDNTGCGNQLAEVISSFNPNWDSQKSPDQCFSEAVDFATIILRKKFNHILSVHRAVKLVENALANSSGRIVCLPKYMPWASVLIPSDAEFVVYPSQRGGYSAQVIPVDFDSKDVKCPFPEEWGGKPAKYLQAVTGIRTLTFCHKARFLISADSLDDALRACRLAQKAAGR